MSAFTALVQHARLHQARSSHTEGLLGPVESNEGEEQIPRDLAVTTVGIWASRAPKEARLSGVQSVWTPHDLASLGALTGVPRS